MRTSLKPTGWAKVSFLLLLGHMNVQRYMYMHASLRLAHVRSRSGGGGGWRMGRWAGGDRGCEVDLGRVSWHGRLLLRGEPRRDLVCSTASGINPSSGGRLRHGVGRPAVGFRTERQVGEVGAGECVHVAVEHDGQQVISRGGGGTRGRTRTSRRQRRGREIPVYGDRMKSKVPRAASSPAAPFSADR